MAHVESESGSSSEGSEQLKACPRCGGTWAASRRNCLACGMSIADVPVLTEQPAPSEGQIDWGWLDSLSPEAVSTTRPELSQRKQGRRPVRYLVLLAGLLILGGCIALVSAVTSWLTGSAAPGTSLAVGLVLIAGGPLVWLARGE